MPRFKPRPRLRTDGKSMPISDFFVDFGKEGAKDVIYTVTDSPTSVSSTSENTMKGRPLNHSDLPTPGGVAYNAIKATFSGPAPAATGSIRTKMDPRAQMATQAQFRLDERQEKFLEAERRKAFKQTVAQTRELIEGLNRQSVGFKYVRENEIYQDCCVVEIPAVEQEQFMTGLEKLAFGDITTE